LEALKKEKYFVCITAKQDSLFSRTCSLARKKKVDDSSRLDVVEIARAA
jgi:hypothetical protein